MSNSVFNLARVASVVIALGCLGRCLSGAQDAKSEMRHEIDFLETTKSLPIEYRADLVLTAVENDVGLRKSPKIRSLVRSIYDQAGNAQYPFPVVITSQVRADSVENQLSGDFHFLHLDALSIRLRSLRILAADLPRTSYDLFWQIPIEIERVNCSDAMTPDVSGFYETLGLLIPSWRASGAVTDEKIVAKVTDHINRLRSPLPSSSLANLLASLPLSQSAMQEVSRSYQEFLARSDPSDRELEALVIRDHFLDAITTLVSGNNESTPRATAVLESVRIFLLRSSREACRDTTLDRNSVVVEYNKLVSDHGTRAGQALSAKDFSAALGQVSANVHIVEPEGAAFNSLRVLQRFWTRRATGYEVADKESWKQSTEEVVRAAEQTTSSDECALCNFYQKFILYWSAVNFAPAGDLRRKIVGDYTESLMSTSIKQSDPMPWIVRLKLILNLSRPEMDKDQARRIADLQKHGILLMAIPFPEAKIVLDELRFSKDPIVAAYYQNEILLKPKLSLPY